MYFPKFVERNVQLIGLSIDSVYAHLGWVYNIYKATGIEIPFPVIADLDMKIAKKYGMISPTLSTTSTVRNVFIIDEKQIIRCILQYPMTAGRYIPEILRIIDSLQTTDCEKVATPANWLPGLPVIVPAPTTYQELKERLACNKGLCCVDWYLCFKEDKKCVEQKVMEMPMMETKCIEKPIPTPLPVQVAPMPVEKPVICAPPVAKPVEVTPPPVVPVPVAPTPIAPIPVTPAPIAPKPIAPIEKPIKIKGKG